MAIEFERALQRLNTAYDEGRLGHAYLVSGGDESSRNRLAHGILAHVNGGGALEVLRHPDVHVVEPQSKSRRITIEQIRNLEADLSLKKGPGQRKVGLLIDAERMTVQASNAFLKTLEEPTGDSLLLLLTGAPDALLQTIISRCIPVNLREPPKLEWADHELALLNLLRDRVTGERADAIGALRLARQFQAMLVQAKERVEKMHDTELKGEEKQYKQTTDGAWLGERETYHAAAAQAEYLQARVALIELLSSWWAAVLRVKYGRPQPLPDEYRPSIERLAERMETPDVLKRLEALEQMRGHLERNIQEPLALDVGFMEAFG